MELRWCNAELIAGGNLPGPSAVLTMADSPGQVPLVKDVLACVDRTVLCFNDATEDHGLVKAPTPGHAREILTAYRQAKINPVVRFFLAQCEEGVGRSQAVIAALLRIEGKDDTDILANGTYNRLLHRLLLQEAGLPVPAEPLVSMVVRVKYPLDRLEAFILSMRRQRHRNWELVVVTDGPVDSPLWLETERLRVIQTPVAKGRWGHPWRQLGIDTAAGEWIGLSNDDNYYVPGYLEQMLFAAELKGADLVCCKMLHSYSGWSVVGIGADLGSFLVRSDLAKSVPWPGDDFKADRRWLAALMDKAGKAAVVDRPLFVHC